ncbi:helix-turn-helix protein [Azorhizobium sp. AG788]|uniref:helix-turn-helix domain-containing protein n=1 Tax=Azorhizobium sp. AG788 TaxID=2183897 RepID=UPI00105C5F21|nr:helix-turn-helix domain-containing protein [Azorhizobium sp. AG788]TDT94901.1 helix-turn-helix protein [Azorhizobium sp. AG788]
MDAASRLAQRLARHPFTDAERAALRARLALGPDESLARLISAMKADRPVRADVFLAAHAVKGWDPLTSRPLLPGVPAARGPMEWGFLALSLRLARMQPGRPDLTGRAAARLARVTASTWCRAEGGKAVSVPSLFALCAFLGRHPHEMCEPRRSTGNAHCNALQSHSYAAAAVG